MRASASSRMMSCPLRSLNRTVFCPMTRPLYPNIVTERHRQTSI
jgi:hypothetical protein